MKVEICTKDRTTSVKVDGIEIADRITGYSLTQKALERPMLTLTFMPDEIEISADRIYVRKDVDDNITE